MTEKAGVAFVAATNYTNVAVHMWPAIDTR